MRHFLILCTVFVFSYDGRYTCRQKYLVHYTVQFTLKITFYNCSIYLKTSYTASIVFNRKYHIKTDFSLIEKVFAVTVLQNKHPVQSQHVVVIPLRKNVYVKSLRSEKEQKFIRCRRYSDAVQVNKVKKLC